MIRGLLKLPANSQVQRSNGTPTSGSPGKAWVSEGVTFPPGTEFRGTRKGVTHYARVENGELIAEGKGAARGLSPAVKLATGKGENGWRFWSCKRPGDTDFKLVDQFRHRK